jgi:hypothetical protein
MLTEYKKASQNTDGKVRGWELIEWLERLTDNVATVLGSIPASSGSVESEGRQMKQCCKKYWKISQSNIEDRLHYCNVHLVVENILIFRYIMGILRMCRSQLAKPYGFSFYPGRRYIWQVLSQLAKPCAFSFNSRNSRGKFFASFWSQLANPCGFSFLPLVLLSEVVNLVSFGPWRQNQGLFA